MVPHQLLALFGQHEVTKSKQNEERCWHLWINKEVNLSSLFIHKCQPGWVKNSTWVLYDFELNFLGWYFQSGFITTSWSTVGTYQPLVKPGNCHRPSWAAEMKNRCSRHQKCLNRFDRFRFGGKPQMHLSFLKLSDMLFLVLVFYFFLF